jgi:hypothetical protein
MILLITAPGNAGTPTAAALLQRAAVDAARATGIDEDAHPRERPERPGTGDLPGQWAEALTEVSACHRHQGSVALTATASLGRPAGHVDDVLRTHPAPAGRAHAVRS